MEEVRERWGLTALSTEEQIEAAYNQKMYVVAMTEARLYAEFNMNDQLAQIQSEKHLLLANLPKATPPQH